MNSLSEPIFRPRRLGHSNLWVSDLGSSERFYSEVCGLFVQFWEPNVVASFLGTGNTPHDIGIVETTHGEARYGRDGVLQIPAGVGGNVGLNHIAWELENEAQLVEGFEKLETAGITPELTVDHQIARSIYMSDPDGNQVEFYCDTVKDWRNVVHGEMSLLTSRWMPGESAPSTEPLHDEHPKISIVELAPVHPQRMSHVVLTTDEADRLVRFYTKIAGLQVVSRDSKAGVTYLRATHAGYACHLIIVSSAAPSYHHTAFELADEDEVDRAEQALENAGAIPLKSVNLPWKRGFFLSDPDGLLTEYYVLRSGERSFPPSADELAFLV